MRWPLVIVVAASCGPAPPRQAMYPAGDTRDDGHGLLARASSRWYTSEDDDALPSGPVPRRYMYGGDAYGGDAYGGGAYGGTSYAGYAVPPWGYPSVNRMPHYQQRAGLAGAIEGTVTWRGAAPKVTTGCGTFDAVAVGAERGVEGALVYIDKVTVGRVLPSSLGEQRPSSVGGVVVKRGCAFAPVTQVVYPIPAQLAVHGDAQRARVKLTPATGAATVRDLQPAGRVAMQLGLGVTRVEAEDGSLGAAWVVGVDTPYFAVTDEAGRFRIDELAAGTYELTVWQPPVPSVSGGKLAYGAPVITKRTIKVDATKPARADIALGSAK